MDKLQKILKQVSDGINWDNYQNEDGTYWDTKNALWCQMTWLAEYLTDRVKGGDEEAEEHLFHLEDVLTILEHLPKDRIK